MNFIVQFHDIFPNWVGKGYGHGVLLEIAGFINTTTVIPEIVVEEDKPTTKNDQYQYNTGMLAGQITIDFASVVVPYGIGANANGFNTFRSVDELMEFLKNLK